MKQYIINIACLCKATPRASVDRYPCFGGTCCVHYQGTAWGKLQ